MQNCNRCNTQTNITTMSMFNTQMICIPCKDTEKQHTKYKEAEQADIEAIKNKNYNFEGIGLPDDLK